MLYSEMYSTLKECKVKILWTGEKVKHIVIENICIYEMSDFSLL